jgi:hypothetical protein
MKPPPGQSHWQVLWARDKLGLVLSTGDTIKDYRVEDYAVRDVAPDLDSWQAGVILDELSVDICDRVIQRDELRKALPGVDVRLIGKVT